MTCGVIEPNGAPMETLPRHAARAAKPEEIVMTAYGFGYLWNVRMGPEIVEYLERIDASLAPFGGRFIAHGGRISVLEGDLPAGDAIIIEFPDFSSAQDWYRSDAYAAIKTLRSRNSHGHILLVDGVPPDHKATDVLASAQP